MVKINKALPLSPSTNWADLLGRYRIKVINISQLAAIELQTRTHSEWDLGENHFGDLVMVQIGGQA